jgi:Ca-activated chloride channel family protein
MSFADPIWLLALPLLLALGWLAVRLARGRRRRYALRFPATATVALAAGEGPPAWRRLLPAALVSLAALALVLALAKPERTVQVPVEEASVVLVSDASGSMAARDVEPTRLGAARGAAERFLDEVPEELRVGLVGFSSAPHTVLRPTLDRETVRGTLNGLEADGGTATGDALAAALETLRPSRPGAKRPPSAIVLLSDGAVTDGRDPVEIAREAGRLKIPIYTVSLGTDEGVVPGGPGGLIPVPPDPETMREVAQASGGQAFTAEDADQLDGVYERLGSQIGTKPEQREVTAAFAGFGLVLLLVGAGLGVRWRGWV